MNKYRKVLKQRETVVKDDDEIRVTANGSVSAYISRAAKLLNEMDKTVFTITATGNALTKAVTAAEVIKRRFKGLHQITKLGSQDIVDEYEPLEEGLDKVTDTRSVPVMEIKLSKDPLDKHDSGYQEPIDESLVTEVGPEEIMKGRGRGRGGGGGGRGGKGKGKGKSKGKSKSRSRAESSSPKGKGKGKGGSKGKGKSKGKSKSRSSSPVKKGGGKGKGKSKSKGRDRSPSDSRSPMRKGKGKGKGKGTKGVDGKGKGKSTKGSSSWDNDWYDSYSYSKGASSKGKSKGKAMDKGKGKGMDKGKGKGKDKGSKGKGKGKKGSPSWY